MIQPIIFIAPGLVSVFDDEFEFAHVKSEEHIQFLNDLMGCCVNHFIKTQKLFFEITTKPQDNFTQVVFDDQVVATLDMDKEYVERVIDEIIVVASTLLLCIKSSAFITYLLDYRFSPEIFQTIAFISDPNYLSKKEEAMEKWGSLMNTRRS
jgi:hypothetical protein